jgi:hypothetical protein
LGTTRRAAQVQAQNQNGGSSATVQLAAARDLSKPARQDAVAIQDKRKTAVRKSDPK